MARWAKTTRTRDISQPWPRITITPKAKGSRPPATPMGRCLSQSASHTGHAPMPRMGASPCGSRPGGVCTNNAPPSRGGVCARKRGGPRTCCGHSRGCGPLESTARCSLTVGLLPSAGAHAVAVGTGRCCVPASLSPRSMTRSARRGPKRSGSSGISADRGPRQAGGRGPPWGARSKGTAPSCRLPSVACAGSGTIGLHTRRRFCAPIGRSQHSQSGRSLKSAGPLPWTTSRANRLWAWPICGCSRMQRRQSGARWWL